MIGEIMEVKQPGRSTRSTEGTPQSPLNPKGRSWEEIIAFHKRKFALDSLPTAFQSGAAFPTARSNPCQTELSSKSPVNTLFPTELCSSEPPMPLI